MRRAPGRAHSLLHRPCEELGVWIDGKHRLRGYGAPDATVRIGCRWLATLLVAWGLLETKLGYKGRARVLARRAAQLDEGKAKVLCWKIVAE